MTKITNTIITTILAIFLAVAMAASGLFACLMPPTTRILSERTSNFENSAYTEAWLTDLACATRDFTVNPYGEGGELEALQLLSTTELQAARECSSPESPTAAEWEPVIGQVNLNARMAAPELMYQVADLNDRYALDEDAISHLVDCNVLINGAMPWLIACAVAAAVGLTALHLANKRNPRWAAVAARACTAAPMVLLAAFAVLGAWAVADFNSFFAAFHGVFFPQGNWTFSYDSLLITMYPIDFWVGMAGLWAAVTVAACIICLLLGKIIRRKVVHD